jgi:hypothetical protein
MAETSGPPTEIERLAHYRELAAQFRGWAETETNGEARTGLLEIARQYDRLAAELRGRVDAAVRAKRD